MSSHGRDKRNREKPSEQFQHEVVACSPVMELFRGYSKLLNEKNDKYERIYKTGRDITLRSKRVIFSLQRLPGIEEEEKTKILTSTSNELRDIEQTLLKHIAMELRDEEPYQFIGAYTGGIQEYIEALTFHQYLLTETIISHADVQERLTYGSREDSEAEVVPMSVLVTPKDFILGVSDVTGELMRYCIKSVSVGDFKTCFKICDLLRKMNSGYLSLGFLSSRELYHKKNVFKSSLSKVEEACYSLQLRKSEIPEDMLGSFFAMYDALDEDNSLI
ncbi:translin associated factor X isoform X2 [Oratosquilla oratoria]